MTKMECGRSTEYGKRTNAGRNTFILACSAAALVASVTAHGAKPKPVPDINAAVCMSILGVWTPRICTIPEGSAGIATSDFRIPRGSTLDVKGSLTISAGVTVDNSGTIIVENVAGVSTPFDVSAWGAGVLILGTLESSGAITIKNEAANTEGITISASYSEKNPPYPDPFTLVPGTLANSGTISIQNHFETRGIKNLGVIDNAASGTIAVENGLTSSVGIYNRRDDFLGPKYYVSGTLTNAGRITIANGGDANGYGIYNVALFTNEPSGTFAINPGASDAGGFYNAGSFTNYGTFINNRGTFETLGAQVQIGSFNNNGSMINYGATYAGTASALGTGTFVNYEGSSIMINLGKITSYGIFADMTAAATMINYGTFYNYGGIGGGINKGVCIDEPSPLPFAGGC